MGFTPRSLPRLLALAVVVAAVFGSRAALESPRFSARTRPSTGESELSIASSTSQGGRKAVAEAASQMSPITPVPGTGGTFVTRDRRGAAFFHAGGIAFALAGPKGAGGWGLHWGLEGARRSDPVPKGTLQGRIHTLTGDPSSSKTDQPTYAGVRYPEILAGIDMVVESRPHGVKYTLHAAPGTPVGSLRLRLEGAEDLRVSPDGTSVEARTPVGAIREDGLICYQEGPEGPEHVDARYVPAGSDTYAIEVGAHDPGRALIVDPVITWSTYLGGTLNPVAGDPADRGHTVAVDPQGNVYVAGWTTAFNFPTAGGFVQRPSGDLDVFVAKLNSSGSSLVWGTYLGGTYADYPWAIAVDEAGDVIVTGSTSSFDFPTTGGMDSTMGGSSDAFVSKISSSGSALLWSTFLGGGGVDAGRGLALDKFGNILVVGDTASSNFPLLNAYRATWAAGEGFLTRFSPAGVLLSSTFVGGSQGDDLQGVAVDSGGKIYLVGNTGSTDLPASISAYQPTFNGLGSDIFIAKMDESASSIVWLTYFGGSLYDGGRAIAVDAQKHVYVAGNASLNDFPVLKGFDKTNGGGQEGFVAKFSANGSGLLWSTFVGGAGNDTVTDIALISSGVFVTGVTNSPDFPTKGGFKTTKTVGYTDGFVMKIRKDGSLAWSSYLGGSGDDGGGGVATDASGNVVVVGETSSDDFPTTPGAYDRVGGGPAWAIPKHYDAFVTKVKDGANPTILWSTYLGGDSGPGNEYGRGISIDAAGNCFVTGFTSSIDFPTVGAIQPSHGPFNDAFVSKFDPAGGLIWSTYLGGSSDDQGVALAVDGAGNVYVAGGSSSAEMATPGAAQQTLSGFMDAFAAKISASGSSLLWFTFIGGSSGEFGHGIALDSSNNVYVVGETQSSDFPATVSQTTYGGNHDAFVAKIHSSGTSFLWLSYLGGAGDDMGYDAAVDGSDNLLVSGTTYSPDFPATAGLDTTLNGGRDGFAAQFGSDGTKIWATYVGGSGIDEAYGIAADGSGNVIVAGSTDSANFPGLAGFDTTINGSTDAFVLKLSSNGSPVWATYLGGNSWDSIGPVSVEAVTGDIVAAGTTGSSNFPLLNPLRSTHAGGAEAFVVRIAPDGASLVWSSFLGGSGWDEARAMAIAPSGDVYVVGHTNSLDFPSTGGFDTALGGNYDAFVTRIQVAPPPAAKTLRPGK